METVRLVAIAIGGLIAFAGGMAFLWAGAYEIGVGRRPSGFLDWSLLTRSRPIGAEWSVNRWRRNGFQVIVMGLGVLVLAPGSSWRR